MILARLSTAIVSRRSNVQTVWSTFFTPLYLVCQSVQFRIGSFPSENFE